MAVDLTRLPDDLPVPVDDGAADHLDGHRAARGRPDRDRRIRRRARPARARAHDPVRVPADRRTRHAQLPDDWDAIPGARGCTAEACAFRDDHAELLAAGASAVYGLSTQAPTTSARPSSGCTCRSRCSATRRFALTRALRLPTFEVDGRTLLRRLTMVVRDGVVEKVFYPVFPPDRHAAEVLAWLVRTPGSSGRAAP